ncbi:hypothetical protein [Alteriqipengyuania lutimaris]|uniref:Uncharacterized protein n=1 Tax=Alteriqipengyuania lutimaris TaxID=1538146 RepID=A0A395LL81_9SPHN|nr:hypothetical protein [Alteriqipengyuania lutimaris]MBB3033480.1 drug/metabolite transporter (DMT)-like permease [Alteriqipengyuania lutimaris]RDS77505.1 hypothetical protein DL238_07740 [Alteriqipengyuania lutimaris]
MANDPQSDGASDADVSRAARRYWTLQFVRLAGIFLTFVGAMMVVGRIEGGMLGPIAFVAGPVLFFAVPILLARRWKREQR